MTQDMDLLNKVYQDTKMGEENLNILLKSVKETDLRDDLVTQMQGYSQPQQQGEETNLCKRRQPGGKSLLSETDGGWDDSL